MAPPIGMDPIQLTRSDKKATSTESTENNKHTPQADLRLNMPHENPMNSRAIHEFACQIVLTMKSTRHLPWPIYRKSARLEDR